MRGFSKTTEVEHPSKKTTVVLEPTTQDSTLEVRNGTVVPIFPQAIFTALFSVVVTVRATGKIVVPSRQTGVLDFPPANLLPIRGADVVENPTNRDGTVATTTPATVAGWLVSGLDGATGTVRVVAMKLGERSATTMAV